MEDLLEEEIFENSVVKSRLTKRCDDLFLDINLVLIWPDAKFSEYLRDEKNYTKSNLLIWIIQSNTRPGDYKPWRLWGLLVLGLRAGQIGLELAIRCPI